VLLGDTVFASVVSSRLVAKVKLALTSALAAVVLGVSVLPSPALSRSSPDLSAGPMAEVALADLPSQGRRTYELILQGGPFPYGKDGSVFGNRERLLPPHPRGYYRAYTVKTPFSSDRGARRIVCGGSQPRKPDVCYYTNDHYASFRRITP
jgi:ribonuclease T1